MKRTISIFFSSIFLYSLALSAQDAQRSPLVRKGMPKVEQKVKQREDKISSELSLRAQEFLAEDSIASEQISWRRAVYRFIDLLQSANAPLYNPEIPTKQEANLFTHIFRLYATGQLPVYEYIDGAERLDDAHRLSFPDFLERFHINYIEGQEHTIPSSEVKAYYLKEAHVFDEGTSTYATQVEALCPVLTGVGDYGEVRLPLFWVRYRDLAPFLHDVPLPLSEENTAYRGTLFDFFRLGLYKGEIVKTENLRGRTLMQEHKTPEEQKTAQERIEQDLSGFKAQLYLPDSTLYQPKSSAKNGYKGKSKGKKLHVDSPKTASSPQPLTRSARGRGY